jgi:hypothetical protein
MKWFYVRRQGKLVTQVDYYLQLLIEGMLQVAGDRMKS